MEFSLLQCQKVQGSRTAMESRELDAAPAPDDGRKSEHDWVLEALEPDQLVQSKQERLGRRQFTKTEVIALWALRLYVVFMTCVVLYQLVRGPGS